MHRRLDSAELRRRLCDLREQPWLRLVRVAQPLGGVRRHHDRLQLCGVHQRLHRRARGLPPRLSGPPDPGGHVSDPPSPAISARHPAPRRLLVRLLGLLLHLCLVVRRRGPAPGRRAPRVPGAPARLHLPPRTPEPKWRLGRRLHIVLRQGLRPERHGCLWRPGLRRREHGVGLAFPHGSRVHGHEGRSTGHPVPHGPSAP
mmetsp:Transcript_13203/g.38355  ORF Transcript_13203/g.38355 Transcript_13203/m.38355 type:complete len:201 (+) Transcript_13203:334-936(+)